MKWRVRFCPRCNTERIVQRGGTCGECGDKLPRGIDSTGGGYNAKPTVGAYSGKQRDSKQEADREPVLQAFANAGRITDLELKPGAYQLVVYGTREVEALIDALDGATRDEALAAARDLLGARHVIGSYTPDFQYLDHRGELVVEDVKGWKISRDFPLRKKLMVACHNIDVRVIKEQRGVQQWARGAGAKGKGTGSRLRGTRALKRGASAALKGER